MKKLHLIITSLMVLTFPVLGQQVKLNARIEVKLHSASEQTAHTIYVQLPKSYGKLQAPLPVIVLLDAQDQTLFDYTSAAVDRLMYTNDIPEAILVGILQNDRNKELSVERNEESTIAFQHFLKAELKDYLQQSYQASSYYTFIGHSLGGQFVTNALLTDPLFFRSVISISGALNYPPEYTFYHRKVLGRLQNFLSGSNAITQPKQKYYFSVGSDGFQDSGFKWGAFSADSMLKHRANRSSLDCKFDYLPGFNHMTTPLPSIPAGLTFIYKDWHLSDSLAMDVLLQQKTDPMLAIRHKKDFIQSIYGVALAIPYSAYYQFRTFCISQGRLDQAKLLSQDIIDQYPDNDESYGLMADVLGMQGNKSAALQYYRIAQSKSAPGKYKKQVDALTK